MIQAKIKSYAKLNLALNITGKTAALHKIESIVTFATLHDEIYIKKIKSKFHKILFIGKFSQNINKSNSVSKLLQILEEKKLLSNKKFIIKINKRIPSKAGLGGGSMNAANILKYFYKKKIIKVSKMELLKISKLIGSDVILGLNSTNTILNTNNKLNYFKKCQKFNILITKPRFGCSTKEIYSRVKKFNQPKFNKPKKNMFKVNYLKAMNNSLEPIVLAKYDKLKEIKLFLEKVSSPIFVRMTGSGSAIVAYFQSKHRCDYAKKQFIKKYKNFWCITSKTI
tara:strand:+ start:2209 stop:3054 length:846 start_codon:yes stop_codon:yes gene_type:complete